MLCRKCEQKLKEAQPTLDILATISPSPFYCENPKCEDFGYVVMVGFEEDNKQDD